MHLTKCLARGDVPSWMNKGRTVLIQKDKDKGTAANNYRPITCLPLTWKLLTIIIADEIYEYLDSEMMLPEEQKGCRRKPRGTHDLLFIDKMILKKVKTRQKNHATAWIDYKKAFDLIPHSWSLECLKMLGINEEIRKLLEESMKNWRVELVCGSASLGEVSIIRGIFQRDSMSPLLFVIALISLTHILRKVEPTYKFSDDGERINNLLFMDDLRPYAMNEKGVDSLIQTVRVFSEDIGMEFGIEKCAVLVMKRGKVVKSEGIKLPDYKTIQGLKDGDSYKYLGILEADRIKHEEMKETVTKECKRRVRTILETKRNEGNLVKAINTWAIPLLRYSAAFLDWRKSELQDLDRKTRKLLTMHNGLHPKSNVERIYIPREEGGRGLISVEDCVESATLGLERYINDSDERLIKAARKISGGHNNETEVEYKIRKKNERKEQWREKVMHGQFVRQTEEILGNESWL